LHIYRIAIYYQEANLEGAAADAPHVFAVDTSKEMEMAVNAEHVIYPAIVACMNEARAPRREEIRRVAARIRSEAFPGLAPGNRRIYRAALAALGLIAAAGNRRARYGWKRS
jgi:hypothetical protein